MGDIVSVNCVVCNGINVRCLFDFKDGILLRVSNDYSMSYVYNEVGVYKVEIICYNVVNLVK